MRILLVRPDGLGDEILCLPVASALRRLIRGSHISFLSSAYAAPLLVHHPALDAILTVNGQETGRELVALFRRGFDAAVFLKPFRHLMLAAFLARVPIRVATGYRWYSVLANRRVYEHRHDFSKHESEYNLGLLAGLGLEPGPLVPPRLVLTEDERAWARAALSGLPEPRVVVHPGGISSRTWRLEHYARLVRVLVDEGFGAILTGTEAERRDMNETPAGRASATAGILDLRGRLTIRELMAVIAASGVVVSGCTGPCHMAAALDVPTVSLFDPQRKTLPTRWRPLGRGLVLRPDVPTCERCIYEACPYWDCLDRISVEHVVKRVGQVVGSADTVTVTVLPV